MNNKSIPGAVLGLIGTVLAVVGGINIAFCATVVGASANAVGASGGETYAIVSYLLGFGAAVVALVGAILDFKKNIVGGILQAVAFVMILVLCIVVYFSVWEIIAMVLLAIGSIVSFAVKKPVEGK